MSKKDPTTAKWKYAKGQGPTTKKKKGKSCLAKTKKNNTGSIHVFTKCIGRGRNETVENLNMVRKSHSSSVCKKRGHSAPVVEGGTKTT